MHYLHSTGDKLLEIAQIQCALYTYYEKHEHLDIMICANHKFAIKKNKRYFGIVHEGCKMM
jgi:hypothetical protein